MDIRQPSTRSAAPPVSTASHPSSLRNDSRRGLTPTAQPPQQPEAQYVIYIKLPYNRNGFVDPPQVDWDAAKERYLWRVLSRDRNRDVDWDTLASTLSVTRPFLLQQAAYLYERELSQIQAQMRRAGVAAPSTVTVPGSPRPQPLERTPSNRPAAAQMSRTSSLRPSTATPQPRAVAPIATPPRAVSPERETSVPSSPETTSTESTTDEPVGRSMRFLRPAGNLSDDDEEEPAFLPFSAAVRTEEKRRNRGDGGTSGASEMESMGSSFSDISESASVTQSQLEEAYLSEVGRHGMGGSLMVGGSAMMGTMRGTVRGLGGRVSGLVRSRYFGGDGEGQGEGPNSG